MTETSSAVGGRRADDRSRVRYQQRVACYAMLLIAVITCASFARDTDLGANLTSLLTWVVSGNVLVVLAAVLGSKEALAFVQLLSSKKNSTK